MQISCDECQKYLTDDIHIASNQRRTGYVVVLASLTMIVEIIAGFLTHSMALTAEGWHMASHAGAMLIAVIAYRLARSPKVSRHFSFGAGKLIPLGGYTSAVVLTIVALFILGESLSRFFSPESIAFNEAIGVAALGLCVNIASALILNHDDPLHGHLHSPHDHASDHQGEHHESHDHKHEDDHQEHDHGHSHHGHHLVHDHNLRSAFLHVVLDAVTSVLAIVALTIGKFYQVEWLDSAVGVVGALVILLWAFRLLRDAGSELLDRHSPVVNPGKLRAVVETEGVRIIDFHVWRIAPKAIACELVIESKRARGHAHYRDLLLQNFPLHHVLIEERPATIPG